MSLSSCSECWDTPCTCGHSYQHWTDDELYSQIAMLMGVLSVRTQTSLDAIIERLKERYS